MMINKWFNFYLNEAPETQQGRPLPQWLLGKRIVFKPTGREFVVGMVSKKHLYVIYETKFLRSLQSATKIMTSNPHAGCNNYLELWEYKGMSLHIALDIPLS